MTMIAVEKVRNKAESGVKNTENALSDAQNAAKRFKKTFEPRTDEEIYQALFDKPIENCVKMKGTQDQVVPKIDIAIFLHFETCPDEFKRILAKREFTKKVQITKNWRDNGVTNPVWFKPELLGDKILIYESLDKRANGQIFYSNMSNTEVYCMDIYD